MRLRFRARDIFLLSIPSLLAFSGVTRAGAANETSPDPARTLTADGAWVQLSTPARGGHSLVVDAARGRLILFGGFDPNPRSDLWWMPIDGSSGWRPLASSAVRPFRLHQTAIWDPLRDRILVFGGDSSTVRFNEVWALSLGGFPTWQLLAPAGTPPSARVNHAMIYDPVRDRMLVFGGNDGGLLNDVWALSLGGTPTWNPITPTGAAPAARSLHSMIYDPARDRAVVYGGKAGDDYFGDVWALTLSGTPAWTPIVPGGLAPEPRSAHRALYDPSQDGMVVFGGSTTLELLFSPTPEWVTLPAPDGWLSSTESAVVHDVAGNRMIVHGGQIDLKRFENRTWAMDLGSRVWSLLGPDLPVRRSGHTMIFDPATRRAFLHGGIGDGGTLGGYGEPLADVWSLSLGGSHSWSPIAASGSPPVRWDHSAIVAPARGSMIVFGGDGTSNVWELTLGGTPAWSILATAGTPAPPRSSHSAVYDAARDRMLVFGGGSGGSGTSDVWALTLSGTPTWTQLAPAGSPPSARSAHSAIYDPDADRMIVFGGSFQTGQLTNEVWALSLSPAPVWTQLTPVGTPPSARRDCAAAYDANRNRMLIFGDQANRSEVWALGLSGAPAWTRLAPAEFKPAGRGHSAAVYDDVGDRFVLFGGLWENQVWSPYFLGDTWSLAFSNAVSVPPPATTFRARLDPAIPNPALRATTIGFSLPRAARTRLAIYDLAGRRLRILRDEVMGAGPQRVRWDLEDDDGARVPPGLYLCELNSGDARASRKILVVD